MEALKYLIDQIVNQRKLPVLAEITNVYTEKGKYYIDCEELTNFMKKTKITYVKVNLPKLWGTDNGGIWMTPSKGAIVLLSFLNGDSNFPIVSNIMGGMHTSDHPENTLIIKCGKTELQLDEKIKLSAGGEDLGKILSEIADKISNLTTYGSPTTQKILPDQQSWWLHLKNNVLPKIFK